MGDPRFVHGMSAERGMKRFQTTQPLAGKVALITGASRGIGRAIAQRFASAGATVVVTARSLEKSTEFTGTLRETVALIEQAGGKAYPIAADLTVPSERDALIPCTLEVAGRLDILVNNAGFADYALVENMSEETYDNTMYHYLKVPFKLCQAAIKPMTAQGAGWIVNLGSPTALRPVKPYNDFERLAGESVYAAAKAAIHRFTQGLAPDMVDGDGYGSGIQGKYPRHGVVMARRHPHIKSRQSDWRLWAINCHFKDGFDHPR